MVFQYIKEQIIEIMGVEEDEILLDSHLFDELDADSLDISQIVLAIENDYKIALEDEKIAEWKTVSDIVNYIENLVHNK